MFRLLKKKRVFIPLGVVASLAIAAGAFAYFTSTGSGTGSATVGSPANWTVTDTSTPVTLYPGAGSFAVTGTVVNPTGGAHQLLSTLTVTIGAPTGTGTDSSIAACTAADFALTSANSSGWVISNGGDTATYTWTNNDLAAGASQAFPTGLSISMNDLAHDQGNCQTATVHWTDAAA
jgi:hypothetical protein